MFLNMWSIHVMLARNCQVWFPAEMLLLNVECPYHYGLYNDRSLDPPGPVRNHNQLLSELDINIFLRLSSTLTKRTREIIVLKKRSPVNNALFLLMVGPFMIFLSPTRWIPYSLRTAWQNAIFSYKSVDLLSSLSALSALVGVVGRSPAPDHCHTFNTNHEPGWGDRIKYESNSNKENFLTNLLSTKSIKLEKIGNISLNPCHVFFCLFKKREFMSIC